MNLCIETCDCAGYLIFIRECFYDNKAMCARLVYVHEATSPYLHGNFSTCKLSICPITSVTQWKSVAFSEIGMCGFESHRLSNLLCIVKFSLVPRNASWKFLYDPHGNDLVTEHWSLKIQCESPHHKEANLWVNSHLVLGFLSQTLHYVPRYQSESHKQHVLHFCFEIYRD